MAGRRDGIGRGKSGRPSSSGSPTRNTRIQAIAHGWGLSAGVVSINEFAMVFEIAMTG
jgi:hypothetical protein